MWAAAVFMNQSGTAYNGARASDGPCTTFSCRTRCLGQPRKWAQISLGATRAPKTFLRLEWIMESIICIWFFGRFPAELGPETRSKGSGLKNGAERTQK